jgi:pyrroline-5-carboxylate reductase
MNKTKIGIIGGGNMGGAMAGGIHKAYSVAVCEQDQKRARWLKRKYNVFIGDLKTVIEDARAVILAVKPQDFNVMLEEVRPYITVKQLVISIAAGVTCCYIEKRLGAKNRVVRAMPNLPVQVGEGMTGLCAGAAATKADLALARRLFGCLGKTVVVEEKWMDAVTAVSGSGPAYVFLFMECMDEAVRSLGLERPLGQELVLQTIRGSLELLARQKEEAGVLRARVTSKGGTTQAAMDVFKKYEIEKIFKEALGAAQRRAKELSK